MPPRQDGSSFRSTAGQDGSSFRSTAGQDGSSFRSTLGGMRLAVGAAVILLAPVAGAADPRVNVQATRGANTQGAAPAAKRVEPETAPSPPSLGAAAASLTRDLYKIVEVQESVGWKIDRYELEEMMPDALQSVCAVPVNVRELALRQLESQLQKLGGPVEAAYERAGRDLGDLDDLLFVTRVHALLELAVARSADECPFFAKPSLEFRGIQTDEGRITANLEGGGLAVLHQTRGTVDLGGGGSTRLLLGYGVSHRYTLLVGGDFGVYALIDQDPETGAFPVNLVGAVPVVLRRHVVSWMQEVEVAPVGFATREDLALSYGVRLGGLVGISTLRVRGVAPWAGIGVAFEYLFENETRSWITSAKAGIRFGFDWSPM